MEYYEYTLSELAQRVVLLYVKQNKKHKANFKINVPFSNLTFPLPMSKWLQRKFKIYF